MWARRLAMNRSSAAAPAVNSALCVSSAGLLASKNAVISAGGRSGRTPPCSNSNAATAAATVTSRFRRDASPLAAAAAAAAAVSGSGTAPYATGRDVVASPGEAVLDRHDAVQGLGQP